MELKHILKKYKQIYHFFERDIWTISFDRFRAASRGVMKDFEIFVGGNSTNNSLIKSTMNLFDAVLESLSHALSSNHD